MENNNRPVDFERLRLNITQTSPCPGETALRPQELKEAVESHLAGDRFQKLPSTCGPFLKEIRDFYQDMAKKQEELMKIDGIEDEDVDRVTWNSCRITGTQLDLALSRSLSLYTAAAAEPGEAVGAIGAQSISEPGTQMTLKVRKAQCVFHGSNVLCIFLFSSFYRCLIIRRSTLPESAQ
jgi:DNA-directed RNA polymerase III subunit RPC1